jgi:Tol biopolymer transport system component
MPPERWERIKEAFDAIVDLDTAGRATALSELRSQDPDLRAAVEELVANHDRAGEFLTEPMALELVPALTDGEILAGRYQIVRFIGRGGMGEVYEAQDNQLGERVALKTISPDIALDERYVARFIREVKLARKVTNNHVCRVHDVGQQDESTRRISFLTMQLVEGETLAARLRRCHHLSAAEAFPLIEQMAEALSAAHEENIIHRDFKPANIMLAAENGETRVVVTDFGLARSALIAQSVQSGLESGKPPGTPGYIAPELFHAGARATVASDIYSFGVVIREMLAGKRPAPGGDAPPPLPPLEARWANAIQRCLDPDPSRRFQSALEVANAIRPEGLAVRLAAWARKHPYMSGAAVVVLFGTVLTAPEVIRWLTSTQVVPEIRQVTFESGLSDYPAVSSDGKMLVYASDRGGTGNLNLYVRQVDGEGEPIRLTSHEADDYSPSFSADSARIVFRSDLGGGGVYQIPTLGGEAQLLAKGGWGPTFSPDGKWIAYWVGMPGSGFVPGSSQVYVKPAGGGPAKALQTNLVATVWPVWAPDSKRLLLVGRPNTKEEPSVSVDWWVVGLNGGPVVKTSALAAFRAQHLTYPLGQDWMAPIAWLPGDQRILFSATSGDTNNLWEIPISDSGKVITPPRQRTFNTSLDLHAFSVGEPKGPVRRLLFSSLTGSVNVWSLPIDANTGRITGEMENLTKGVSYAAAPSVSADGKKLVFIAARSKTWSVRTRDLETGKETTLASMDASTRVNARWLRPRISPDGGIVAYVDPDDHLYVVDTQTGATEKVCDGCGPPTDVSLGGQKVLFEPLGPPEHVMMIDVPAKRKTPMVASQAADHILYQGRFSPDGRWVAFHAALDNSLNKKVFISPIHDGHGAEEKDWIPVTDGLQVDANVAWSPDGNLLYFFSERDGFRCIWAQHLEPATKQPAGSAFPVKHFHNPRQSVKRVDRWDLTGLSAAQGRLVFAVSELMGNIWMEERKTAGAGWFLRLMAAISQ